MRLDIRRSAFRVALSFALAALAPACVAGAGAESQEAEPAREAAPREEVGSAAQAITASFGNQTVFGWGNGVTNVFTGDFNGDGKWDIGVTGTDAQGDRHWYIQYGDGHGNFGNQTVYYWGNGVTNVFTGDFNGDGKWDIGVTGTDSQSDRNWYIRYGDGHGNFGNQTVYYWGNGVTNVFTGDFDGDGKWDIGVTGTDSQSDHNWYIRYGDGTGNFGNQTVSGWGNGVTNVFTGDFDGDGKWDIGVTGTASQSDRTWHIRLGDGHGNFGTESVYSWGNGVTNVFTGDFNGDHMWDIGVTGTASQSDHNWYVRYNLNPAPCLGGQVRVTDTGACVTLTPWNGSALPNGARIVMQASTRFKNDGCSGCTGVEGFGPAWVKLTSYQWNSANPTYDYWDASGSTLTSGAIFTVTSVPRGSGEYIAGNNPWSYQKLLIQGADGLYASADDTGALISSTDQSDAAILILDLTQGTNAGLYWTGYSYSMNSYMVNDDYISTYGASYIAMNGLTFYQFMNGGFSPASFASLYIVN